MAGSLTLAGMADGLTIGQLIVGPSTMMGKAANSQVLNVELAASTDFVVKVPTEATAFAVVFSGESTSEVKVRTNLNNADTGYPLIAQGWMTLPIYSGTTELKFKATSPPSAFQLAFI